VRLAALLGGAVDHVFIDRMNYVPTVKRFHARHGLEYALSDSFFTTQTASLTRALRARGVRARVVA
jgi:hypothetical protein